VDDGIIVAIEFCGEIVVVTRVYIDLGVVVIVFGGDLKVVVSGGVFVVGLNFVVVSILQSVYCGCIVVVNRAIVDSRVNADVSGVSGVCMNCIVVDVGVVSWIFSFVVHCVAVTVSHPVYCVSILVVKISIDELGVNGADFGGVLKADVSGVSGVFLIFVVVSISHAVYCGCIVVVNRAIVDLGVQITDFGGDLNVDVSGVSGVGMNCVLVDVGVVSMKFSFAVDFVFVSFSHAKYCGCIVVVNRVIVDLGVNGIDFGGVLKADVSGVSGTGLNWVVVDVGVVAKSSSNGVEVAK
jgi:hypothetical protein